MASVFIYRWLGVEYSPLSPGSIPRLGLLAIPSSGAKSFASCSLEENIFGWGPKGLSRYCNRALERGIAFHLFRCSDSGRRSWTREDSPVGLFCDEIIGHWRFASDNVDASKARGSVHPPDHLKHPGIVNRMVESGPDSTLDLLNRKSEPRPKWTWDPPGELCSPHPV